MPSRSPRTVSVIGVNGWYSANQRIAGGNVSVGTNPLPRNGSRISGIGRLLAVSTLLVHQPERDREPDHGQGHERQQPEEREPVQHRRGRPEADEHRRAEHDHERHQRLDQRAEHVAR